MMILIIFFYFFVEEGHWPIQNYRFVMHAFVASVLAIVFFLLYPQIKFKPHVRTLTVDDNGIRTVIGKKSGEVSWEDILSIEEASDYISIVRKKTLNAFVIPPRAFNSDEKREDFLSKIRNWQQSANNRVEQSRETRCSP